MHISPSLRSYVPANINVVHGSKKLSQVEHLSILGVSVTHDLSWSCHSRKIRAKISSRMAAIRRFICSMNSLTRMSAYNAFVQPYLIYCLPVWGKKNATVTNEMNHNLSRCLRIIFGSRETTFSRSQFSSCNIFNFQTEVLIKILWPCTLRSTHPPRNESATSINYLHRTTLVHQQAAS